MFVFNYKSLPDLEDKNICMMMINGSIYESHPFEIIFISVLQIMVKKITLLGSGSEGPKDQARGIFKFSMR